MSRKNWFGAEQDGHAEYASADDFRQFFESEATALMRLALILTAEPGKARSCFLQARTDCIANGSVVRDFTSSWARRRIIVNAIEILNHNGPVSASHAEEASDNQWIESALQCCLQSRQPLSAISALTDFERLCYVICVHEEYSLYECALLLNSSPTVVDEAQRSVREQINKFDSSGIGAAGGVPPESDSENAGGEAYDSCGSLLN